MLNDQEPKNDRVRTTNDQRMTVLRDWECVLCYGGFFGHWEFDMGHGSALFPHPAQGLLPDCKPTTTDYNAHFESHFWSSLSRPRVELGAGGRWRQGALNGRGQVRDARNRFSPVATLDSALPRLLAGARS